MRRTVVSCWTAVAVLLLGSAMAVSQDQDQGDDPPPEAGRLSTIQGNVSVQPAGAQDWGQAYVNLPLGPGDRIYTDQGSRAEIQVGQTYVRIGPNTDITLVDATSQAITFGVGAGSADVHAFGLWPDQQLQVQTPSGTGTVNEATDFRVDVYAPQQSDQDQQGGDVSAVFTPFNGNVQVQGADDVGATVPAGQSFELAGTNPVYPQWLEPAGPDELDQWSRMRDGQVARARSYQYISPGMPGGYELDNAGQWQAGTEYGNVWFPNVEPGWAPYRNGHWVNRDPWGWVWVEDEPWGYAPFHYGRWVNYRGRWGWIPGPAQAHPVWSPALVVFAGGVQGGSGALSVWFPLGPGEPYRPWYPCSPRYVDRVNITNIQPAPRVQVRNTYVNITNVNVTNITYVNRTVGATAVPREAFASGRQVRQAEVRLSAQQLQQARVEARPAVQPTRANLIARPATKPVPVKARPVLINAKGMAVAAQPHAKPAPPPVRQIAAPRPIPGRKAVAPPANAKMTPAAQKAQQQHPAAVAGKPAQGNGPGQAQPGNRPGQANGQGQREIGNRPGQPNGQGQQQIGNRPGQSNGQQPLGNRPGQGNPQDQRQQGNQPGQRPGSPNGQGRQQPGNPPGQGDGQEQPGMHGRPGEPQRPGAEQPNGRPGQQPGAPQPPQNQSRPEHPGMTPQRPGAEPPNGRPGQQQPGAPRGPENQSRPEHPGVTPQRPGAEPPNGRPGQPRPDQPNARPGQQQPGRPGEAPNTRQGPEQRPGPGQQRPGAEPQQRPRPDQPGARPGTSGAEGRPSPEARRPEQRPAPQEQNSAPEHRPSARPENHPAPSANNGKPNDKKETDKNKPKKPDQNPPQ